MDGATLQARIYAGYARAAARAGNEYALFRGGPIDPTDSGYSLGPIPCLFSADKKFAAPVKFQIPTRYLYADGRILQQRDIIVGPYGTFFVGDMQPVLPIQVVRCNETVSVDRPTYIGTTLTPVPIVSNMPAFRQLKKIEEKSVTGIGGASTAATAIGNFLLFLPVAPGLLKQGDNLTDSADLHYSVDTIDNTEIGVVLTIRQSLST